MTGFSYQPTKIVLRRPLKSAQYASETYRKALDEAGLRGSMSAIGNPYHNAQAESFMKTLKVEDVYLAGWRGSWAGRAWSAWFKWKTS